ncbi:hypothetical protein AALP_AA5G154700 [Arabis alpina]|uniref:Uncharacterized protein n=1 Tax=Arabis alpina TaxID=50452 RepID=A0A087GXA8_ARAAL|nr:hypothetical protein AALP_AA5G154700 [Arabis alpina]
MITSLLPSTTHSFTLLICLDRKHLFASLFPRNVGCTILLHTMSLGEARNLELQPCM